jgi:3-hydroxyisobutyrate dehydrogenase-like beta-hydroxyacid dehydrogenase
MQIHFIGVGKMGLPLAGHLRKAGHAVTVADANAQRRALAESTGLRVGGGEALAAAEVIISSLPHDEALRAVAAEVARGARRGTVFVDTSTVSQAVSAEAALLCEAAGIAHVRSTVSGNNAMAEAALLTVMASGPRTAYERVLPLLQTFGPHQFWLGEAEQARLMKLVVNLMIAQTSAMLAEALTLGSKGGIGWQDLWAVLGASAVASPILKAKAVPLAQRDFTPTFTVEQMQKDVGLILDAGAALQAPLPGIALTAQLLQAAAAQGHGGEDYAAVIKVVERLAGVKTA